MPDPERVSFDDYSRMKQVETRAVADPLTSRYPRGRDEASQDAFDSIDGPHRARLQDDVLAVVTGAERGATTDEIEVAMAGRHQSVSPRVIELERAGLIRRSGEKRATRSGRLAHVYVAGGAS